MATLPDPILDYDPLHAALAVLDYYRQRLAACETARDVGGIIVYTQAIERQSARLADLPDPQALTGAPAEPSSARPAGVDSALPLPPPPQPPAPTVETELPGLRKKRRRGPGQMSLF